ncbi:hypothetical protein ACPW96_11715 [Micromonospora sp. DT81.3]|uniref:hypothetical protein n=1 Tax=Actinomycetes TaxID=1760 RepID=UPI003CEA9D3F
MQLGTRWTSGDEPPAAVPKELRSAIAEVDDTYVLTSDGAPRPRWTLTWLEGRPVAELDSGVIVRLTAEGEAVVEHDPDTGFGGH